MKAFKIIRVIDGKKRSFYHNELEVFGVSLVYDTIKPTPKNVPVFTLDHIKLAQSVAKSSCVPNLEIWECEGNGMDWFEATNRLSDDVGLNILPKTNFMESVVLTKLVEIID